IRDRNVTGVQTCALPILSRAQKIVTNLLAVADIQINGTRPWDIQVHDARFFSRVLASGALGFGESYMEDWWDCIALDEMCYRAKIGRASCRERGAAWEAT